MRGRPAICESTVRQVRRLHQANVGPVAVASLLNISRMTVHRIITGQHVSDRRNRQTLSRCPDCGALTKRGHLCPVRLREATSTMQPMCAVN